MKPNVAGEDPKTSTAADLDFSVSGFRPRARRRVRDKSAKIYVSDLKKEIMESQQNTPPSPERATLREYWRNQKRELRARGKTKVE